MIVSIIGLGLIGGSLALDLKKNGFADTIIGVDSNPNHVQIALKLNLIDAVLPLQKAVQMANLVIIATPVKATLNILPQILAYVLPHTVITDMGSTKILITQTIENKLNRKQFVASHPMAGTEHSGPNAALHQLFANKVAIICNAQDSHPHAVELIQKMYKALNMHVLYMSATEHDMHVAYISHISHISSFVLATTVLEKEKIDDTIFNLASGGFDSTVRLAKSSPQMWAPIFEQNSKNILEVMDTYIEQLQQWRQLIANQNFKELENRMTEANTIRRILDTPPIERLKKG